MSDEHKSAVSASQWTAAALMILAFIVAIVWRYFWPYPPVYIGLVFAALLAAGVIAAKVTRPRNGASGVETSGDGSASGPDQGSSSESAKNGQPR